MAHVSQTLKKSLAPAIKAICKTHGVKATLSVGHHMSLILTIKSGKIDFFESFNRLGMASARSDHLPFQPETHDIRVNPYHYRRHFDGRALKFLQEVIPAMLGPDYYDNSDPQTDYFDCSHYIDVNIGKWDKPYILEK